MKDFIKTQLEALKTEHAGLSDKYQDLVEECDQAVKEVVTPFFKMHGILEHGAYLKVRDNTFHIQVRKYASENHTYSDDLIYFRIDGGKIYKNFYSTNDNSEFEFKRMVIIGRTAEMFLESGDELIAKYQEVYFSFKETRKEVSTQMAQLRNRIKELDDHLEEIGFKEVMGLLKEGVEFEQVSYPAYMPYLTFGFNRESNIRSLKVIEVKGKTASIQYRRAWAMEEYLEDKVRLVNIENFAKRYTKEIKVAMGVEVAAEVD